MPIVRSTATFPAPVEKVFLYVDSPEYLKLWMEGLVDVTYPEEFDPASPVGTKFKMKIKEGKAINEYDGEVLEYEPNKRLVVSNYNSSWRMVISYDFTVLDGEQTRLDYVCTMEMHTVMAKIMGWMFLWFSKMLLRKFMRNLAKAIAEDRHPA